MTRICIGIHVHAEPDRLRATLASVQANTPRGFEVLLLPDGADEPTRKALRLLTDMRQLATAEPRGAAACFNRLAISTDADVLVLLESGSLVAPGWLDYLLAALDADPRNGLAGPSTNSVWNEQCAFPRARGEAHVLARTAAEAARRFGGCARTLEPLYSLADFCYVVRRKVVETIGAADEGYGLGPCWEMDYSIRAARAGWRGVWACGSYVYRAPFTARRQREEQLRFEASKWRYQDKFCALRLLQQRVDYEPHCRGDACEHFAPRELIQIQLPLSTPKNDPPQPQVIARDGAPLISCIMPTRDRAEWALQAIRYFQQQDYPVRELIIVDDGADDLARQLPDDPRIRYARVPTGASIGAKRNRACERARGSIIAHWDDDDWYAPNRLSAQVAPLLSASADITGLNAEIFFELAPWEFWKCTPELHRHLFVGDVHGGTLVYHRRVWEQWAQYPDRSLAEDALFLQQAVRRGARLCKIESTGLFIYIRHANNSWAFRCGQHLDPRGWQRLPEPPLPPEDRAFYATRTGHAPALPLVSCIMPTADRRQFVAQAIQYFLRQDYANRELIVVDDGVDAVRDLIPPDARVRYLRLKRKESLGAKRNLACCEAQGEIIAHWDDDDWMASWRLSYQVNELRKHQADICGLDQLLYYDLDSGEAWQYAYSGGKPWVSGNTLCYTKHFWQASPFPEINVGEDTRFVWSAPPKQIVRMNDKNFYIAVIHPKNTSPKKPRGAYWHSYPTEALRTMMGEDYAFYATRSATFTRPSDVINIHKGQENSCRGYFPHPRLFE